MDKIDEYDLVNPVRQRKGRGKLFQHMAHSVENEGIAACDGPAYPSAIFAVI